MRDAAEGAATENARGGYKTHREQGACLDDPIPTHHATDGFQRRSLVRMAYSPKKCLKCNKEIKAELHKIVIYVVQEKFTEHHYEHVECPDKFTI